MKTGRNDPCPCGSGRKYKKCCFGKQETPPDSGSMDETMAEIRRLMADQQFSSLEEAQAFANRFMRQRNQDPRDDFQGLSPEQMHRFLHFPFESPKLVTFPPVLAVTPTAPIITLFSILAEGLGDKGLKPTATGNLPQKFCREAACRFLGKEEYQRRTERYAIRSETDFFDLHVVRLVAGLAGLIRKYRGRFILGRECRQILARHGMAGIYPRLFDAYVKKFNWAFRDSYPEIYFLQRSFLFSLYLLSRHGDQWQPHIFYEDCFLQAFPAVLQEVEPRPYSTPEETVRRCYTWRCLENFAEFLGLAEVEQVSEGIIDRQYRVKKLPLLDAVCQFPNPKGKETTE